VIDDISVLNVNKPGLEMFVEDRVEWVHSLENDDVNQFKGMPQPPPTV
jgi:hypothetical protein